MSIFSAYPKPNENGQPDADRERTRSRETRLVACIIVTTIIVAIAWTSSTTASIYGILISNF